VHVVFKVKQS